MRVRVQRSITANCIAEHGPKRSGMALPTIVTACGLSVSKEPLDRIKSCNDLNILDKWIASVTAASAVAEAISDA